EQQNDSDRLVSVVGASKLGGDAFSLGGVQPLLLIIASINISFGIFNLLPLLPLDGGHIAVVAVDKIRSIIARIRKRTQPAPTDYEKLVPVTLFFAALIAIVAITALANDIIHPINLPS
ncbi:MAG TPA: site-2 protease family protein, partial [Mycobacteriales bacterium]|nr:site-2 protease family protein [Mycobacteriales bacterium]